MTKEVLRNVKILGERISKRFNNKLPKTGEKTASNTGGSHVSHKQKLILANGHWQTGTLSCWICGKMG